MMECICGQGFTYTRVVDEDRQKGYSNLVKETSTKSNNDGRLNPPVYAYLPLNSWKGVFLSVTATQNCWRRIASAGGTSLPARASDRSIALISRASSRRACGPAAQASTWPSQPRASGNDYLARRELYLAHVSVCYCVACA
jgi:hypothetical protein